MTIREKVIANLSRRQADMLWRALDLTQHGACGVYPVGSQFATVRALERRGLLRFAGYGIDIDGGRDDDVPIWEITDKGRDALGEG